MQKEKKKHQSPCSHVSIFHKVLAWLLAQIVHEQVVVWLGTNTINKYSIFIEDRAGISWGVLLVPSCCISCVLHTLIQWLDYPLFTESVWVIL